MNSLACAIFFPPRQNMREAVAEAMQNRPARGELATDGRRVAWLPRVLPGWFPVSLDGLKEAA